MAFPAPPAPEPRAAHFSQPTLRRAVRLATARLPLASRQKLSFFEFFFKISSNFVVKAAPNAAHQTVKLHCNIFKHLGHCS